MPIAIEILSGARIGEHIEFDQPKISFGAALDSDILFDASEDEGATNVSGQIALHPDGWHIQNLGGANFFVDHTRIENAQRVRSGATVRLSEVGPDFTFSLISRLSKPVSSSDASSTVPPVPPVPTIESQNEETNSPKKQTEAPEESSPPVIRPWVTANQVLIIGLIGCAIVGLLAFMFWGGSSGNVVRLEPAILIEAEEGSLVVWSPKVAGTLPPGASVSFSHELAPEGFTMDTRTGMVRWTPTEADGPGDFGIIVRMTIAAQGEQELTSETRLDIRVSEKNAAPTVGTVEPLEFDTNQGKLFTYQIRATDSDLPTQKLQYQFDTSPPNGVALDTSTGMLTVRADTLDDAPGILDLPISIADDWAAPGVAKVNIRINIVVPGTPVSDEAIRKKYESSMVWLGFEVRGVSWAYCSAWRMQTGHIISCGEYVDDLLSASRFPETKLFMCESKSASIRAIQKLRVHRKYVAEGVERFSGQSLLHNFGLVQDDILASEDTVAIPTSDLPDPLVGAEVLYLVHNIGKKTRFDGITRPVLLSVRGRVVSTRPFPDAPNCLPLLSLEMDFQAPIDRVQGGLVVDRSGNPLGTLAKFQENYFCVLFSNFER